jgi:hypothetical protein
MATMCGRSSPARSATSTGGSAALWKCGIRGGVGSIETTYYPGIGWHIHAHVLAARQAWSMWIP